MFITSANHETKSATADLSDEGIDDPFVLVPTEGGRRYAMAASLRLLELAEPFLPIHYRTEK